MRNNLLRFGLRLDPDVSRADDGVRPASAAEEAGLDYLAVPDHPYQADHLDIWTYAHRDSTVLVAGAVLAPGDRTTLDRVWRPVGAHPRGAYGNLESRPDAEAFRRFYPGATDDRVLATWRHHDPDGTFRSALYSGELS